ncbi:hypothetical protein ACH5A3_40745 [Streptomyces echinatus]|uniref:hypothetical protein n=1 Tax=Streptomyces echinatus TaxID=67293 RepID=UPI0037B628B9
MGTSELAKADQLLLEQWGCDLDAIGAVLATVINWPTGEIGTVTVTREDPVAESAAWSGLPTDQLPARLDAGQTARDTAGTAPRR